MNCSVVKILAYETLKQHSADLDRPRVCDKAWWNTRTGGVIRQVSGVWHRQQCSVDPGPCLDSQLCHSCLGKLYQNTIVVFYQADLWTCLSLTITQRRIIHSKINRKFRKWRGLRQGQVCLKIQHFCPTSWRKVFMISTFFACAAD